MLSIVPTEQHERFQREIASLTVDLPAATAEPSPRLVRGERRWLQWTDRAIFGERGQIVEFQSVGRDVTERKLLEEQLTLRAHYDPVTGLPNRTLFTERLARALANRRRRRGGIAVLFLDMDGFKLINDSLGHDAGDALLAVVGGRLAACLRAGDTPARFGGDEFAVLIGGIADPSDAVRGAERILDALRPPFAVAGREVFLTAGVGIALRMPEDPAASADELVREADIALYRAKAAGKAHAAVFDPSMNTQILERVNLEADLRRAVDRGEMRLEYEPEVDLQSGRIVGMEALARWEHPGRGLLAPADFVRVAEEAGLIVPIGRWVLGEACRQARAWQGRYPGEPRLLMSVNLSARELQQPDLVEHVAAVLDETGLAPACLRLEITESVLMDDAPATEAVVRALRALGVRLAIDDFGTGYSSLAYLRRFPVHTLKVDRSFVTPLDRDEQATAIVRAVTALGHALGMEVTAEGVETAAQWSRLSAIGCNYGQGYHFARPAPAEAMSALLATGLSRRVPATSTPAARPR